MATVLGNVDRQDDEIQVLQAVFMDDFVDLRKETVWKTRTPPEIRITVRPQLSMGGNQNNHTKVDLFVKCSSLYPDKIPDFKLENPKGITNQEILLLKQELDHQINGLVGEVMILEMSQTVQKFLYAHNRPAPKSFYEEMLSNKQQQEEKLALEQQKRNNIVRRKEERERQLIEEEIAKRQQILKEELKRKKNEEKQEEVNICIPALPDHLLESTPISPIYPLPERKLISANTNTKRHRRTSTGVAEEDAEHDCRRNNHKTGVQVLIFHCNKGDKTIHKGKCLGHNENGSTVYAGMDTITGEVVAIAEWVFQWRHIAKKKKEIIELDEEGNIYMKQVLSIEQEMTSLIKLSHPNLLHFLGMKSNREPGIITVHILTEYYGAGSLDRYFKKKEAVAIEILRKYTNGLLQALEYLHNKAVVHKNLCSSNVFRDANDVIKLGDYSCNKRLIELFELVDKNRPGVHFSVSPPVVGKGGKKGDIYQLGILLLSLSEGFKVTEMLPKIPTHLPQIFHDFLTKCLMNDDKLRWSATQLRDHQFLKDTVPPALSDSSQEDNDVKETIKKDVVVIKERIVDLEDENVPFITAFEASGRSRLTNEFDIIKSLGKGGFGDVLKVRNKLDGRVYAIKRIPLNPKSQQLTKKITREVKLLSRLNHENVVRYYNSWIEISDDPAQSDTSSSGTSTSKSTTDSQKAPASLPAAISNMAYTNSIGLVDDIEAFAPPKLDETSVEWSYSINVSKSQKDASDSDSDDEDNVFAGSIFPFEDSDSIIFGNNEDDEEDEDQDPIDSSASQVQQNKKEQVFDETDSSTESGQKLQYLYIQMEYCEKSTLRNCIDAGLFEDIDRVWRLFREIVEGLIHLHDQGMIHRDLKPVNIFLDSNDHVKIGDFGLATTDILVKQNLLPGTGPSKLGHMSDLYLNTSKSTSLGGDDDLTGNVGTALYVSPEVKATGGKFHYDQKVDIYSLGIIFFEMCYRPLDTGMERVMLLGKLRLPTIQLPSDFDEIEKAQQVHILKWLLNHDPSCRPTSKELLQSDYLPPPQMEEAELNEVLRSTISNPQSKSYRRMIDTLFTQPFSPVMDLTYTTDLYKGLFSPKLALVQKSVYEMIEKVFQRHGAVKLSTPLLMPKCEVYKATEQFVCLMDHSGGLVELPCDLRVPFARYIARSNIQSVKRYSLDKVYQEKKFFGLHPKDMTECAFDIVTPSQFGLIPEAELLAVVSEVVNEFSELQERNYYFRVNHTSLLKAILLHCGIPSDKEEEVLLCLRDYQHKKPMRRHALQTRCGVTFNEQTSAIFFTLLDYEGSYSKISSLLRTLVKSKGPASTFAKQGLHELETVLTYASTLGVTLEMIVTVGQIYNPLQYSGIIFQLMFEHRKKKRLVADVLAAGGRYDQLIKKFQSRFNEDINMALPSAVGVSFAFEKIVAAVFENNKPPLSSHDIVVCCIGHKPMWKERLSVVKDLWAAGLSAEVLYDSVQNLEDVQLYCRNLNIPYTVYLKDGDAGSVRIRWIEKDRTIEKKVLLTEMVDFLQQKLQMAKAEVNETATSSKTSGSGIPSSDANLNQAPKTNGPGFNFIFINQDVKLAGNARRRLETQIFGKVSSAWPWLPGKSLDVIAINLDGTVLKTIAAYLELNSDEPAFEKSISAVIDKQLRHKKYLVKIIDQIHELKFQNKCPYFVLYSIKDDSMKLLT